MTYQTREEWLTAALQLIRGANPSIASRVRVACGFPSTFRRSGTLAESWPSEASGDATFEVLISPTVALPVEVFPLLLAQALHSLPGAMSRDSATWRAACLDAGLVPADEQWRGVTAGPAVWEAYGDGLEALGAYPHAEIAAGVKKTQATRMLKLSCPQCGYIVRTTGKWLATGVPTCHDGTPFVVETSEESPL